MKPFAENQITITKKLFHEAFQATAEKSYHQSVNRLLRVLLVLGALLFCYIIYCGLSPFYLFGEIFFLSAVVLWLKLLLPRQKRKKAYRSFCNEEEAPPKRTTQFFEDHFVVLSEEGETIFSALDTDRKEVIETSNLWILGCNHKNILLDKHGFTIGGIDSIYHRS